jgi:hypothetical protein
MHQINHIEIEEIEIHDVAKRIYDYIYSHENKFIKNLVTTHLFITNEEDLIHEYLRDSHDLDLICPSEKIKGISNRLFSGNHLWKPRALFEGELYIIETPATFKDPIHLERSSTLYFYLQAYASKYGEKEIKFLIQWESPLYDKPTIKDLAVLSKEETIIEINDLSPDESKNYQKFTITNLKPNKKEKLNKNI